MMNFELIGRLGSDPRFNENAKKKDGTTIPVCNFSIAVDQGKNPDSTDKEPKWFQVAVFGNYAKVCAENLYKGRQVFVQASNIRADHNVGKDGKEYVNITLLANNVQFLGSGRKTAPEYTPEDFSYAGA